MEVLRYRLNFFQIAAVVLLVVLIACDVLLLRILCGFVLVWVSIGAQRQLARNTRVAFLNTMANIAEADCTETNTKHVA